MTTTPPPRSSPTTPRHLNAAETAERLRTSTGRLANLRLKGDGPSYLRVGRRVLYPVASLEAYESLHTVVTKNAA